MDKIKIQPKNIFGIIIEGTLIYLKNFIPLSRAMLFPIFGQLMGVILIFLPVYLLMENIHRKFSTEVISNNIILVLLALIILIIPGFFVFIKAFWEFTIAMVSLNSMVEEIVKIGHIKDFTVHNHLIKLRSKDYIILLLILALLWLIGLLLPGAIFFAQTVLNLPYLLAASLFILLEFINIIILVIISNYLSLSFQIFTFEHISPFNILKKSFNFIEGNFLRAFFLGFILAIITGIIIPVIIQFFVTKTNLISILNYPIKVYMATITGNSDAIKYILSQITGNAGSLVLFKDPINDIPQLISLSILGMIVTGIMLPFGSACYTLLYYDIFTRKNLKNKKS